MYFRKMRSSSIGSSLQHNSRQICNILLGNSSCLIFVAVALFNFVSTINALSLESNPINEHLEDSQPYSLSHQANDFNYDTSFDEEYDDKMDANSPSNVRFFENIVIIRHFRLISRQ